ncbi:MAG: ABC transporter permease [Acidimicrobiia bacterium]|nr:ABC transporter permease [Acidimicrobiia bacterium]
MWKVTLKGLAGHRVRFTLTALAVMLGVAFMAGTLVLTDTVGKAFDDLFADVNEGVDVAVRAESPFDDDFGMAIRPRIPADLLDDILAVEGVATAEGFVQGFAQLVDKEGDVVGQPGQGPPTLGFSWPETAELNPLSIAEGRPPEGPADVVIDKKSADDGEFAIGDEIDVVLSSGTRTFTVVGIARFGEVDSPAGATIAVFETATAQEVLDAVGQYDEIDAVAEEGVSQEELAGRVREALAGQESIEVLTGAELTEETQDEIRQQLSFFNNFLLTFAIVALFVGSFIIYNTFSIVVAQRAREMALLRAVGASRAQVLVSVVGEAVVVGLLASIVGMGAGIGLAIGLEALLAGFGIDVPSGAPVVTRGTITAAVVTGVLVTVVAAVVPARKASRVPPVAALRDVAIDTSSGSLLRVILGSLVLLAGVASLFYGLFGEPDNALLVVGGGAGVVFLGMAVLGPVFARPLSRLLGAPLPRLRGITGALARNNAMRNPKRTSATASALMIGVGLVGFITVFAASAKASIGKVIDDAFLADYVVDSGTFGFGGLSPSWRVRSASSPTSRRSRASAAASSRSRATRPRSWRSSPPRSTSSSTSASRPAGSRTWARPTSPSRATGPRRRAGRSATR